MTTAFQISSFQNNAFQIDATPTVVIDTHDGGKEHSERERKRVEEFRRSKEQLRADIEGAWKAITESGEPTVIAEAVQIAKPAIPKVALRRSTPAKPPMPNFDVLSQFRLRQLMQLHQDMMDEEEILLFMDD